MPRLSAFYGIVIYMYRPDHPPPHFHAQYGEYVSQVALGGGEILAGSLPPRAVRLVQEWARLLSRSSRPTGSSRRRLSRWSRSSRCPSMNAMLKVTDVEPLEGHRLRVSFNDGVVREIDCAFLLHGTLGTPLKDLDYFRKVRVDDEARTIVWPNGLDPAPELLHDLPDDLATGDRRPNRAAA